MWMKQTLKKFRCRRGYVLLTVLCIFLIFTILGTNMLVAAYATAGTSSKKYVDSQAYLLASSSLKPLVKQVEAGTFKIQIDRLLADVKQALDNSTTTSACSVSLTSNDFRFVTDGESARLVITFRLNDARYEGVDSAKHVTGTLEARVQAVYGASQYAFIADFSQLYGTSPDEKIWKLQGYRSVRGANIAFS